MVRVVRSLGATLLALAGVVALGVSGSTPSISVIVRLLMNEPHALVMGGTGNPDPSPDYVQAMVDNYAMGFPNSGRYAVHTPAEFWPESTDTFDMATAGGVDDLEAVLADPGHAGRPLVIVGYSGSTRIASIEKAKLVEAGDTRDITFVLISDLNKGNGGIAARFAGWTIPVYGWTFDGATRTDSSFDTTSISIVHDGWGDFPIYPLNVLAVANAVAGIQYLHLSYPDLDHPELTPVGHTGDTDYYMIETDIVPILTPLEQMGVPRPLLLAADEPLRVLIEAGYRRDIAPGAPTPAYLIPVVNPGTVAGNFVRSIPVGIDDALEASDLGRPLGTQPSGPFGVGGEDEELEGLPAGFLPLGNPAAEPAAASPARAREGTEADTEINKSSSPSDRLKSLRPKVRAPIRFEPPKPWHKPGHRSKSAAQVVGNTEPEVGNDTQGRKGRADKAKHRSPTG